MLTTPQKIKLALPHARGFSVPVAKLMNYYSKADDVKLRLRKAKTSGKRTRMGITRFLFEVFKTNELLPRREKLTNERIAAMLLAEFPDQERLHRGIERGGKFGINDYRRRYNSGTLVKDVFPDRCSFRYNADGLAVETRMGRRLLSTADQIKIADNYRLKWRKKGIASRNLETTNVQAP